MAELTRADAVRAQPLAVVRPREAARRPRRPGGGLFAVLLLAATIVYVFVPMLAVVLYGLATSWTAHVLPDGYTLVHWADAMADGRFQGALLRSLGLAIATAALDVALVTPAVYWQRVRNPAIRSVVELLAAIPFSVPFAVIAFGLLGLSGAYTPRLQGTLWLVVPAHVAVAFSFVYWAIDGSMAAADVMRLSEAARTCGAGLGQTLLRVVLPNIGPGVASGAILAFGVSFNDVALVQILAGSRFETVPLYTLNLLKSQDADFNILAVMTGVTFAITLVLSVAVVYLNRGGAAGMASLDTGRAAVA